ncbi:RNA polymerase I enhancer binding protein [Arthrobotrys conoides]|uniref:RNA polymerase I enhancer binding protein n=1 Tax=Arthrobotrys conoides TaxID=74498 RepID=A0AAN8N2H9_9PEZI
MLRSFWTFVASTPQKSSQSHPNLEGEGSPTPSTDRSERQLDMPSTPHQQSSPGGHDGSEDKLVHSPNAKRKRHKKKIKSSPVSIVEVPATAEQLEERIEEDEGEEDAAMADVSNTETGSKRKRRKSDLELSEKKAKRLRKHRKNTGGPTQIVVNGSLHTDELEDGDEEVEVEEEGLGVEGDEEEPGVEGQDDDDEHPYIPGVRWFGDVAGVFFEGKWVEADLSQIEAIKNQKKAQKLRRMEEAQQMENQPEPNLEEENSEAVVEETDRDDKDVEESQKHQKKHDKKAKKHDEPTSGPGETHQTEADLDAEPEPQPAELEEEGDDTARKQKTKGRKTRKQPERGARAEPEPETATKERKRRKSTKEKEVPEESNRRHTYPRATEDVNPPPVIIPSADDRLHGNSKGVGPPPAPVAYDRGPFTPTEDALIQNVINRYCQVQVPRLNRAGFLNIIWNNDRHKTDFWNILMTNLPLRTRQSLHSHVKRIYHDFEDRGKWTQEQDNELSNLVAAKGAKWTVIGGLLGRMPEDCRDRWKNYVVCGEKRRTHYWSEDETEKMLGILDDMLITLVEGHEEAGTLVLAVPEGEGEVEKAARLEKEKICHRGEIDWTIVSERMGFTRSRMQCLAKSRALWEKKDESPEDGNVNGKRGKKTKKARTKKGRKQKQGAEEEEAEEIPLPALKEAKNMLPGDYLFVLQRISVQGYDCLASIDWNKLSEIDTVKHFTPEQFKAGFHSYMRDHNPRKKDLRSFVAEQLGDLSELPGMIRNKRYRPPAGATSPAVAAAPSTGKKDKRQKNQEAAQVQQPGLFVEVEVGSSGSSHHSSPPRRLNRTEKPSHSPGNPFAKQPSSSQKPNSPSKFRTKGEATPVKGSKKSPRKQFKSAEYISDSDGDKNDGDEAADKGAQTGTMMEVDGANEVASNAEVEEPANGSEADDEMGESVAFGNASKDKKR